MHPWNPPPTSWPVPPQPTNAPPTWPQSSQNVHLFGHPSALHPTWSSSASIMPSTSSPTSLPFTSLSPAPHAVPGPQLVPTMPAPLTSEPTMAHTAPSTFPSPSAPTAPPAWPSPPTSSPTSTPPPTSTMPPTPLPSSPYPPHHIQPPLQTNALMVSPDEHPPRPPAVKAAPRPRSDKRMDRPRRPASKAPSSTTPPAPTAAPTSSVPPELVALGSTTQQLAESVRLIQAQQQVIMDTQRAQEQRQLLLQQDGPPPNPIPHIPPPTPVPPLTATPPPAPKARPTEPDVPDLRIVQAPAIAPPHPLPVPSSPTRRPRSRTPRPRSLRPSVHSHRHRYSPPRAERPRSPLPRHRSSTKPDKGRRTPSPYRRRSPPRRRSPVVPRRHRSRPRPRSATPRHRSRGREVILRPAANPSNPNYIPTPDADDTWGTWNDSHYTDNDHHHNPRPNSPAGPPPTEPPTNPPTHTSAPLGAVSFRVPDGDSENSEFTDTISLTKFDTNDIDLDEMVAAANDPHRVRCLTELDPDHVVPLRRSLTPAISQLFNQFVDAMFERLAQPYRTVNNHRIYIKASQATVRNLARAFAQSDLLDIELARQTQAFYIEPENLLTITVPTGLKKKPIYRGEHMGTYLIYHKTSWESVAKILAEDCIRPATWTKNEAGMPTQYPCYGFFGMSSEIADIDHLPGYAVKICTSQLYKIGKGQNPSGLMAICRSPKCIRALAGGNDQIQRLCNLAGIAKGKDNATAMNSSAASICYVASTHTVFPGLITHQTAETNAPSEPPDDSTRPVRPDPSADAPEPSEPAPDDSRDTPSHRETAASGSRDYARRSWHDNASWDNSTYSHRDRRSSYQEDHSRDQHHEGRPRSRHSTHYSRSRW